MAQVEWNGFSPESKDELEYLKLNAQVGWETTKDWFSQFNRLNINEESKQKLEQSKQNVLEARKRRDEFAYAHQDTVGDLGDRILGGLVEGISNPVELGVGIAVGVAAAPIVGTGVIAGATAFGLGVLSDILLEEYKARYYEDRELSNEEILNMVAGEVLMGGVSTGAKYITSNGISGTMNNLTNSFYKATNRAGDIKVEPYKAITQVDNIGISDVAKQQQLQTDFGIKSRDYYSIKPEQVMELNTKVNKVYNTLNGLSEVQDIVPFQKEGMSHNSLLTRTLGPYRDLEGPLTFMTPEVKETNKELFQQLKAETGYDINKTPVQNAVSMRKKENDLVKDFLHNIDDTVEDYYTRNPTGKTNTGKHTVNDRQIREAFNIIDNETKAQIGYVQSEYLNILNQDRVNPVSYKQFVAEVNPDDKSIAKTLILDVNNGSTKLDTEFNSGKFFQTVNADGMLLDEMQMGVNPYEFNDFDKFNRKFGMLFDDEEVIKYDGDTIVALSKANDIDKHTLKMALKENPERYVDIVESINKVLDSDGNINKADKEMIEEIFGTTYKKISNAVKRDADYWRSEFEKMKTEVPNYKGNPYWKREVQNRLNKRKRELSLESNRINKNINKQEMIHEFEQYFEGGLVNESNKGTITLSKTKEIDFEKEIMPYFDNGIFKLNEGQDPVRVFAEFVSDLKLTRRKAKYVDKYKTIGELRDYFNENKMGEFFATGQNEKYLKNNAQNIRDIVDYQARNIGMFNVQGSVSPYYLPSKFKYDLPKIYSQMKGEVIQDSKAKFLNNTVGSMADTFFKNTQLSWEKSALNPAVNITSKVRNHISRAVLGFTGAAELGPMNAATALSRGQMYFGTGHVFNNGKFYVDKLLRDTQRIGDSSVGEFTIGYMNKQMDIGKYGLDLTKTQQFFNGVDSVLYGIQEISDKQLRNMGEIISTAELYKLSTFEKVENQLKSLLRMNNIDETNFADFIKFTKEHIDSNGKYIDIYKLSQLSELGNEYAKALRNVHYQLTDYIGNVKHSSKFNQVYRNEVSRWADLFRSTTRVMNADLINRMLYYTNENGLARCRLNPYNWNSDMLIGSAKGSVFGLSVLAVGGLSSYYIKELIQSNRTMDQRLAVLETKTEEVADLFSDPEFGKVALFMAENANLTPESLFGMSNTPMDIVKKCQRIYDSFTDEEKNLYGISKNKDGWKAVLDFLAPYFITRVGYNNLKAVYKYNTLGDLLSVEKVYGFDKQQQDLYETKVVKYNSKDIDTMLKEDRDMIKAQSSYLNNDTEYFDTLSKQEKEQARIIWDNHPELQEQSVEDYKSSYGYIKANVSNDDELQEGFKVMYSVDISKDLEQSKPKEEPKSKLTKEQMEKLQRLVSFQKEKGYRNDDLINEKDIEDYIKLVVEPLSRNDMGEVQYNFIKYYGI